MTTAELLMTVGLVALTTVAIRALPFWLFPAGKKPPAFVAYLGRPLPAAVMAMLVVYCLKDISFDSAAGFVPALASCVLVVCCTAGSIRWRCPLRGAPRRIWC